MARTLATALWLAGRTTFRRDTPSVAIIPASTSLPVSTVRGTLSPVRAAVSKGASAVSSTPSSGTRSPGFTSMTSPTPTSAGSFVTTSPPTTTEAWSGRNSIRLFMLSRARSTAMSCSVSPMQ